MPDRQNQDGVVGLFKAVKRYIPGATPRNNQFAQPGFNRAANQLVTPEHEYCLFNQIERRSCRARVAVQKEITESLQVPKCLRGVDQSRQDFALGLVGFLPARRLRR